MAVGVKVAVADGVKVGVSVGVAVSVFVGVELAVGVLVEDGIGVGLNVGVDVDVEVADGVGVVVAVGVGLLVSVEVARGVGEGATTVAVWVGFIALFGIALQNGVILVGKINDLRRNGMELHEAVIQGGPMNWREATRVIRDAAAGLEAAHEIGLVHRDIKPANILLSRDGDAKVTDFGLVKDIHATEQLSVTGDILGTPSYMSPEQVQGRVVDHRSDLYSLAICLHEAISGERLYVADLLSTPDQIYSQPITPLERLPMKRTGSMGSALPPALTTMCQSARSRRVGSMRGGRAPGSGWRTGRPATTPATAPVIVVPSSSLGNHPESWRAEDLQNSSETAWRRRPVPSPRSGLARARSQVTAATARPAPGPAGSARRRISVAASSTKNSGIPRLK